MNPNYLIISLNITHHVACSYMFYILLRGSYVIHDSHFSSTIASNLIMHLGFYVMLGWQYYHWLVLRMKAIEAGMDLGVCFIYDWAVCRFKNDIDVFRRVTKCRENSAKIF